jgi:hypothetical protein
MGTFVPTMNFGTGFESNYRPSQMNQDDYLFAKQKMSIERNNNI